MSAAAGMAESERVERELQDAEARYRYLVEHTLDAIFTISSEATIASLNPAFETITGWSCAEWLGKPFAPIVHPQDLPLAMDLFRRVFRGETPPMFELRILSKSGAYVVGEFTMTPRLQSGTVVSALGIARDVTERKRAEEQLKESQRQQQELLDSFDGIVWEVDARDLRFTFVSQQAKRLLGYAPERWLRELTWSDLVHPDDLAQVLTYWKETIEEKRNRDLEYRVLAADGRVAWVRDIATVSVEHDRPAKVRGVLLVITERKQLEAQLIEAQKLEAVGRLAGGIAHDFNNLLTIITGYSQLLLTRLEAEGPFRTEVEEIKRAGERAASLTQQLLAFSRRQMLMPRVVDLNAIVAKMDTLLQRLIGEDIHLVTVPEPKLSSVRADPGQLEQAIMNLAVNARDAMPAGGRLTIETANVEVTQAYLRGQTVVQPGRYVMLAVSDTGIGMDAQTQAHVFEPFFTTKELGKGTGLGLSTVYGIVKQSGGHIIVYSEPGHGATFKIYLPRVDDVVEPVPPAPPPVTLPPGVETILVVEDEPGVRVLVRETLQRHGYTVLEARHGIEALVFGSQHPGPIDLLITDVVMPQISGREVADRLLRERATLRVLYISGYTENAIVHHGVLDPGTSFLQKPFTPDSLVRKVREVLNRDPLGPDRS